MERRGLQSLRTQRLGSHLASLVIFGNKIPLTSGVFASSKRSLLFGFFWVGRFSLGPHFQCRRVVRERF